MKISFYKTLLKALLLCFIIFSCTEKVKEINADSLKNKSKDNTNTAESKRKYIYLTFDDGPLQGSQHIDSVTLAERIKINVFLVGKNIVNSKEMQEYVELYEKNPFIEMYNHSYSHANGKYELYYSNPANVLVDIQKNEQEYHLKYKIVRLPGRNIWRIGGRKRDDIKSSAVAADLLAENGYKLIGWDLEWQHKPSGTPIQSVDQMVKEIENMFKNNESFTQGHVVILMHDEMFRKKWEESELKQLMDILRKNNDYIFEHIRFYPNK